MAILNAFLSDMLLLGVLTVMSNIFCVAKSVEPIDEKGGNGNKIEFKEWFMEIKDPTQNKCNIKSAMSIGNDSEMGKSLVTKPAIINVVKCSTGKGRWNYKIKVILILILVLLIPNILNKIKYI